MCWGNEHTAAQKDCKKRGEQSNHKLEPGALLEDQFVHASLENNVVSKGGGNERTLSSHRFDDPIIRPNPHKYIL